MLGLYIGSCGLEGTQGLWDSLPRDSQELEHSYTEFWQAYQSVLPDYREWRYQSSQVEMLGSRAMAMIVAYRWPKTGGMPSPQLQIDR